MIAEPEAEPAPPLPLPAPLPGDLVSGPDSAPEVRGEPGRGEAWFFGLVVSWVGWIGRESFGGEFWGLLGELRYHFLSRQMRGKSGLELRG